MSNSELSFSSANAPFLHQCNDFLFIIHEIIYLKMRLFLIMILTNIVCCYKELY